MDKRDDGKEARVAKLEKLLAAAVSRIARCERELKAIKEERADLEGEVRRFMEGEFGRLLKGEKDKRQREEWNEARHAEYKAALVRIGFHEPEELADKDDPARGEKIPLEKALKLTFPKEPPAHRLEPPAGHEGHKMVHVKAEDHGRFYLQYLVDKDTTGIPQPEGERGDPVGWRQRVFETRELWEQDLEVRLERARKMMAQWDEDDVEWTTSFRAGYWQWKNRRRRGAEAAWWRWAKRRIM